jgi:D-lactate dehydrogenase (cytochrome)
LDNIPWSLHITVENFDQVAADRALAGLRPLWAGIGREVSPSVPIALRAKPFSIRGIVGIHGERWVPVHGVFALSAAQTVAREIQKFFAAQAGLMTAHGIEHSYLTVSTGAYWVLEPMFYWFDELGPLHARVLGDKYAKFKDIPANPQARAVVARLRREVATLFEGLGAIHSQLGKFYDFKASIAPETYALLTDIKATLDPDVILNPGNLGFTQS